MITFLNLYSYWSVDCELKSHHRRIGGKSNTVVYATKNEATYDGNALQADYAMLKF